MAKNKSVDSVEVPQEQVTNKSDLARARAWDEWLESDEGKKCCEGGISGNYLHNRIELAFVSGWNFCGELIEKRIRDGCQN